MRTFPAMLVLMSLSTASQPAQGQPCMRSDLLVVGDLAPETVGGIARFSGFPDLPYENVVGKSARSVAASAINANPRVIIWDYYSFLPSSERREFISNLESDSHGFYYIAFGFDLNKEVEESGRDLKQLLINQQSAFYRMDPARVKLINVIDLFPFTFGQEGTDLRHALDAYNASGACN